MKNFNVKITKELNSKLQRLYEIRSYSDIIPELYRQLDIIIIAKLTIERFEITSIKYTKLGCYAVNNLELSSLMRTVPGLSSALKLRQQKIHVKRLKDIFSYIGVPNSNMITVNKNCYQDLKLSSIFNGTHWALYALYTNCSSDLIAIKNDLLDNLKVINDYCS